MSPAPRGDVLVIDDERNIRRTLRMVLESEGHRVRDAATAEAGLAMLEEAPADCVILDLRLPGASGMDLLRTLSAAGDGLPCPIIVISGHGTLEEAAQATRLGAFDFLEKPLDRERVVVSVRNALAQTRMAAKVAALEEAAGGRFRMIGTSPAMRRLFDEVAKVAPTRGRVLITGESGTGKELIARAIHEHSPLRGGPFVKVNCAAIAPELIESELFGHEKGAFTGATARKRGLFEVADGGTILLDEVGDMSPPAQAKVLRVLQTGEMTRVGGERPIHVDVRVIAATNKDLKAAVEAGTFREDLYFRLNVVPLHCPPLRERLEDIPDLVRHFVAQICSDNGFRPKEVDPAVIERLRRHTWPGNVRELRNVVERMVIMSDDVIGVADLPPDLGEAPAGSGDISRYRGYTLRAFRAEMERRFIEAELEANGWNISRTAISLGIERTNLHKKMKALGIRRAR